MKPEVPRWRRLSARGQAALQVYEIRGAAALLPRIFQPAAGESGALRFGRVMAQDGVLDEVLLAGPDSEGTCEVSLHGSAAVARSFEALLTQCGAAPADALVPSMEEECLDLARHALSSRTLELALGPATSTLRERLRALPRMLAHEAAELGQDLAQAALRAPLGTSVRSGCEVLLCGAPNAGKSTLFNALAGEDAAIVSHVPGTTRDVLEISLDIEGWPFRLRDAAGIRATPEAIEDLAVGRAREAMRSAQILLVLDAQDAPAAELLKELGHDNRVLCVRSKSDLHGGDGPSICAQTGAGLAELKQRLLECSPFGPWRHADHLPPCAFTGRQQRLFAEVADALLAEAASHEHIETLMRELAP